LSAAGDLAWSRLHTRIDERMLFRIVYASLAVLGSKLIHDGLSQMLAGF